MADDPHFQEPVNEAPPPAPDEAPKSEAAKAREIHRQAEHEHRQAAREAAIKRQEELPEGYVAPNPTRAPSPITHDRFQEEDEGAIGEP
jgi:hypothetical protein